MDKKKDFKTDAKTEKGDDHSLPVRQKKGLQGGGLRKGTTEKIRYGGGENF